MLTQRQYDVLAYINAYILEYGISPSYQEIADACELDSKSRVFYLVEALQERGFIRKLDDRARSITVLKMPESEVLITALQIALDKLLTVYCQLVDSGDCGHGVSSDELEEVQQARAALALGQEEDDGV